MPFWEYFQEELKKLGPPEPNSYDEIKRQNILKNKLAQQAIKKQEAYEAIKTTGGIGG
jgi:hypothetical protein